MRIIRRMRIIRCMRIIRTILIVTFLTGRAAFAQEITLDQAFEKALKDNPTVQAMGERINQAREQVVQARAYYYPSLTISGSADRDRYSDNEVAAGSLGSRYRETYDTALTASWTIFSGFSRKYRLKTSELEEQREQAEKADVIRNLLASVAQSFHTAQLALANKFIASLDETFFAQQLADARVKQAAGKGSLSDVLNFQTSMNQARIEMASYEADYQVARAALAALLGDDAVADALPAPVFPTEETEQELIEPAPETYLSYAADHRPDLISRRLTYDKANANIGFVKANLFPEISIRGSVGADRTNSARFEQDDLENSISLNFSYPLYAGGGDRAALREAVHAAAQARLDLRDLENSVASEIRQNCFSVQSAQKQLTLYRENVALVRQNRDMVALEYRYGKTSLVTLNEVQNTLSETQQKVALSLISLRQAWYELRAASGEIHTEE